MCGSEAAPKVTGMLIDLPIDEIKAYLQDYGMFGVKVQEALNMLQMQMQQQIQQ